MENRWTIKDVLVMALLVAVIASVWIAMKQFDRQWDSVKALTTQVNQLTSVQSRTNSQINELRDILEQGVAITPGVPGTPGVTPGTTPTKDGRPPAVSAIDPFERMKKARAVEGFAQGDTLIDAFGAKVAKITPHTYKDLYGRLVQDNVLEGLLTTNLETLKYEPLIARSWQVSEDGLEIRFQLRRNVVFSDGEPLTSADVVFSLELLQNPKLDNAAQRNFYDNIESCEAIGDYEVVFKMKEPHYMALTMAGGRGVLPRHFYEKYTIEELNRHPGLLIGSGPYRMPDPTAWAPGKQIELVRNERYWGEQPGFDKLVYREIDNDVARLTAFRNGEIDLLTAQPPQYDELRKDKEIMKRSQAYAYDTVPTGYMFIAWQQQADGKPTKFADKRVRQAMTYLADRRRICDEVMLGYAKPASGPFAPGSNQENKSIKAYPYDVAKGKALLKEAGWEDRNGDGVIENEKGEPFRFKFTYPSGNALYERVVLMLKDGYARAGIQMDLDPLEWSVFSARVEGRKFDALTMRWGGGAVEGDIRQMFHSSQIEAGADNFMHYINTELDGIIDEARRTIDDEKRFKLWQRAHEILAEEQPYTFMLTSQALRLLDNRVHNIEIITAGMNLRWEWFAPGPMQKRK